MLMILVLFPIYFYFSSLPRGPSTPISSGTWHEKAASHVRSVMYAYFNHFVNIRTDTPGKLGFIVEGIVVILSFLSVVSCNHC